MAVDSKIKIALELEKAQAQQQLAQFEAAAEAQFKKLQAVQARYASSPTAFARNQLGASTMAFDRRLSSVQGAQANIEKLQLKIDKEEARNGGKLFGVAVNKQTEAFAKQFLGAYLGKELMNIGFAAAYQVGGNNANLRKAQETTEGAATGMQIGAAFGPMGAAIGAVTGGLIGLATASIKLQKEIQREQLERSNENYRNNRDTGRSIQNKMFDRLVDQSTRGGQINLLKRRYDELAKGKGGFSLKSLDARIAKMEANGDIESNDYKMAKENRSRALQELAGLSDSIVDASMKTTLGFQTMGGYNDSLAKQGIYVGGEASSDFRGSMDVKEINKSTLDEVKLIRQIAEHLVQTADKNLSGESGLEYILKNATPRFGI